jgi:hypothetical protein
LRLLRKEPPVPDEPQTRQCPGCEGELNHPKLLICHACWAPLPAKLKQAFNRAPSMPDRRAAYREILEHFRQLKQQPELLLA